jgi:hypothetical protein
VRLRGFLLWLVCTLGAWAQPRTSLYFDCLPRDFQVAQYRDQRWQPCLRNQQNRIPLSQISQPMRFRLSRQGYQTLEVEIPTRLWDSNPEARWPPRLNQILSLQPEVLQVVFATEPAGAEVHLMLPGGASEFLGLSGVPVPLNLARVTGGSAEGQFVVEFRKSGYAPLRVPIGAYALDQQHRRWPAGGSLPLPRIGPSWLWLALPMGMLGLWRSFRPRRQAQSTSRQLGDYAIHEAIGYGAAGKVFRAQHRLTGRKVAVKVLHPYLADDPRQLAAFRQEACVLAQLDHPNVVKVLEWGDDLGRPYLAMELVEGCDLRTALSIDALGADRLCGLLAQAAAGMDWTHRQGIVHRDIKPENLVVTPDGRACWVDFGLAEQRPRAGDESGTSGYLAPERVQGQPASPASDQYSLGALAYEALTGQLPGSQPQLLFFRPHLKPALVAVIDRMLDPDPTRRFASLAEVERVCLSL